MKRPLSDRTRLRIIQELIRREQPETSDEELAEQWDGMSDEELEQALLYNRERKLREIAEAII